jgi:hypothetical protein
VEHPDPAASNADNAWAQPDNTSDWADNSGGGGDWGGSDPGGADDDNSFA